MVIQMEQILQRVHGYLTCEICEKSFDRNYTFQSIKCHLKDIYITNATNKFKSLVITGLADVDGFKFFIQDCVWPGSRPMNFGKSGLVPMS